MSTDELFGSRKVAQYKRPDVSGPIGGSTCGCCGLSVDHRDANRTAVEQNRILSVNTCNFVCRRKCESVYLPSLLPSSLLPI